MLGAPPTQLFTHRHRLGGVLRWAPHLLVVGVILTNVYLVLWRINDLGRFGHEYYLYRDEVQALKWLQNNGTRSEVVLALPTVGQYVPGMTGKKAFVAHPEITADYQIKQGLAEQFFRCGTDDRWRVNLLQAFEIHYVFLGSEERRLGCGESFDRPYLKPIFVSQIGIVYHVQIDGIVP
jgi:uncharacterized membrane protein